MMQGDIKHIITEADINVLAMGFKKRNEGWDARLWRGRD